MTNFCAVGIFSLAIRCALTTRGDFKASILSATMKSIIYSHRNDVTYRTLIWDAAWGISRLSGDMVMNDLRDNNICCCDGVDFATVRREVSRE